MTRPDPFRIYKAGEDSRVCHAIDFPGWAANGWSDAPVEVVEETEPEPAIVVPHDLTMARKTKRPLPKED